MKKIILMMILMMLAVSYNVYAKTINISYNGNPVSQEINLSTGDTVMINTTVPVGTRMFITVTPIGDVNRKTFRFTSSMENVMPYRKGQFIDRLYTGANPGWVSYTYSGRDNIRAKFKIF